MDDQPLPESDPAPASEPPPPAPAPSVPDDPTQALGLEFEWKGGPTAGETLGGVLREPGIERRGQNVASGGGSVYHSFVKEQLAEQDARKSSLEQRGIAVITTSGSLAALLLALAAVVTASEKFELTSSARWLVVAATVAFAVSALGAVATNLPLLYASVRADQMRALVKDKWTMTRRRRNSGSPPRWSISSPSRKSSTGSRAGCFSARSPARHLPSCC